MGIINKDLVTSIFGYWPEFCDGKIESFVYQRPDKFLISISYIDTDSQPNKKAVVELQFGSVSSLELSELRNENVIDSLQVNKSETQWNVSIEACYGLHGSFMCESIEVKSID